MPGLVIVNVPPCTSSGLSFFDRARVGQVVDRAAQAEQVLLVGIPDHRHDQAVVERDGDPEVDVLLVDDVVAVDRGVDDRELPAGRRRSTFAMNAVIGQLGAGGFVLGLLLLAQRATRPKFTS